jgi:hypothetical protein
LVFTNSHFGQAKVHLSPPPASGSLRSNTIRARHIAQRGGLRAPGVSAGVVGSDWSIMSSDRG